MLLAGIQARATVELPCVAGFPPKACGNDESDFGRLIAQTRTEVCNGCVQGDLLGAWCAGGFALSGAADAFKGIRSVRRTTEEFGVESLLLRRISLTFAAGCFGALVNTWVVWYLGRKGIPQRLGVSIAPAWSLGFLYPRLVWGGLWGLVFVMPVWRSGFWIGVFSRGILLSFIPTLFQLFYVFPVLQGKGMLGTSLGALTPVFVCLYNAVWGFCAALWLYFAKADS